MTTAKEQLLQAISRDPSARAEIERAENQEECISIVMAKAESLGVEVSREDVEQGYIQAVNTPLSDQELEAVVGGKSKTIEGTDGNDSLYGGDDNDTIYGNGGNDTMDGGKGNDTMYGGSGNDTMYGGEGNDTMHGGWGADTMYGGAGNDTMSASGESTLDGGEGNDDLTGGTGNQTLLGGEGDDRLEGQVGEDILEGGAGDDVLYGLAKGGQNMPDGTDTFVFGTDDGSDIIGDFNVSEDKLMFRGVESMDELTVTTYEGNTIVLYGNTKVTIEGVTLTQEEVWDLVVDLEAEDS